MKKNYLAPEVEIINVQLEQGFAISDLGVEPYESYESESESY